MPALVASLKVRYLLADVDQIIVRVVICGILQGRGRLAQSINTRTGRTWPDFGCPLAVGAYHSKVARVVCGWLVIRIGPIAFSICRASLEINELSAVQSQDRWCCVFFSGIFCRQIDPK